MTLPPAISCTVCGKAATKHCSRCKLVRYCCKACQRSDWNSGHKSRCRDFLAFVKGNSKQSVPTLQTKKSFPISPVPFSGKTNILNQSKKVLFPYEEFMDFFYWNARSFTPCGLINCGNSCFANVVLQCLTYTKPLVAYLLAKDHLSTCGLNHWCFLCEFQQHVELAFKSCEPFSPTNILSQLPSIDANLSYGKQEDAHEFMRSAINTMQMAFLDEFGGEKAVPASTRETTVIQHIFGGHLQSQVTCSKCNNLSIQFENMMDLTVEIHGESLEKCLHKFTAEECMDGDDMYKCDRCNDYVKARKRLLIHKAPNILTIALKRFQRGKLEKLNQMVTFPENLALYSYMTEEGDDNDMFKLYAVIVHVNKSKASNFGHYICYIKNFDGSWYRIDDDKVLQVKVDEVLSQEAYVLFYRRIVARPTSLYPLESVNEEDHDLVEAEGKQHSPLQPLECRKTTVSPAICADSGSLPTEYSSEVKVVRAKKKLSSIANYEGGKEDPNIVESGASSKGLPELQDVGVSSASEEYSCLRTLLSPFSSSVDAVLAEIFEGRFRVSDREEETERCEGTAYEDQNVVESKASCHDLPELQDVGVSGEAERTHFLSITLSPCPFIDSSAEALVQKPEGSFPVSDIEEKTKTCEENKESTCCLSITLSPCPFIDSSAEVRKPEGSFPVSDIKEKTKTCEENKESLLESSSDDSVASTDAQYDGSASPSSSPEISSDMEFDNSTLLPEKARCEKVFPQTDVLKTDGGSSSGKKLKPLLTPGFLRKRPRPQTRLSCKIRDAEANQPKPEKRQSTNS